MKLPSLQYLAGEARASFVRFPAVMLAALVAAACGIISVEVHDEARFVRVMVTAQLGFPLFFALVAAGEAFAWPTAARRIVSAIAAGALGAYYSTLPDHMEPVAVTRFVQLNVGLHLLAAALPFTRGGRHNGFWQYNRALFMRFLTALLYSAVVYLGLALAIVALDRLLGLPIPDRTYMWLLFVIVFVFNTWVFVGGIPRDIAGLESVTEYPRALKVFAQYILIPLVIIYLTILTAYLLKVIITTVWPSGWIGWMVSSVAVVGILALLLVWPVASSVENRWVATYTRWYFIFMIPAIVMLMLAVQRRVDQYGMTENRYFLAVLSVWLAAVALYFILSRGRRIKMIPVTLCLVAFVTSFGPWGAYSVSRRSQTARLEKLLEANGILVDGAVVKAAGDVSIEDRREISAIATYLDDHHGAKTFERWLDMDGIVRADSLEHGREPDAARAFVSELGIEYVGAWAQGPGDAGHFNYGIGPGEKLFKIEGADYMVVLNGREASSDVAGTGLSVAWSESDGVVLSDGAGVVAAASADSVLARIGRNPGWSDHEIPADIMRVSVENERVRFVVYFNSLGGERRGDKPSIRYLTASCFVKVK